MHVDLTDLRLFLNVAEAGTITGGAQATHMTLASASERIRGMEQDLGTPLLLRERRGVTVTPAGRTLLHHARQVLRQVERMQGELGDFGSGFRGHVRMLCNTSAISEHLPKVLCGFLAAHAGISIDLQERSSDEIVDALRNDVCDLGIVSDSVALHGLAHYLFRADPLCLVVPQGHRLAGRRALSLAEIADEQFVGLAEGSALHEHLAQHARRLGKRLSYRIRLRGLESLCRVVGHGIGVGIVPQAAAVRYGRTARIKRVPLSDPWATRNLVLCMRSLQELPQHVQLLVRHVLGQPARAARAAKRESPQQASGWA
ncbi:LysR substrate-binding domain-containing protein [Orrella sp. JC864]|uniref:LysR substrate-binding domain-containing protein n=1 Tax=Orrella sp. JC864 TaxID=3120298 RepID=UPI003008C7BA